jgi:16S rRNA (uracil1498-N3)-methyltransferase
MKRPPRFATTRNAIAAGSASVTGAELRHLRDVMRLRVGAPVALIDEAGAEYLGRIARFAGSQALIALEDAPAARPAPYRLILAAALIKGPRMDFLIEKAAELGAAELIPLASARAVVHDPGHERLERWRRLATAAAKQSLAPLRMTIRAPITVADLAHGVSRDRCAILCALGAAPLGSVLRNARPAEILLACGPEGGFNAEEISLMRGGGFVEASLGPNRLRAESAALAALSVAVATLHELSGRD